jgi:hypothetical protein
MSGFDLGSGQMAFDLDVLMREQVAARPWSGAPLTYTADYYTPAELEAAFDRYVAEHGRFASYVNSHMWALSMTLKPFEAGAHSIHLLSADGSCELPEHTHAEGELPGAGVCQANCTSCRWHSIHTSENEAVEAWHDHALPGWRELSLVPSTLTKPGWDMERKSREKVMAWVEEHYPATFLERGSSVRTVRPRYGGRHVPNRSPQGGYDVGTVQ